MNIKDSTVGNEKTISLDPQSVLDMKIEKHKAITGKLTTSNEDDTETILRTITDLT